jgi:hypothetical protein
MKQLTSLLPTQSIFYFLVCGAGILVFIFMIILPSQRASEELDAEIEKISARIEEQRILLPVFQALFQKTKNANPTELPVVQREKLPRGEINQALSRFKEIAVQNNLSLVELTPDVNSLADNSGYLLIYLTARGEFADFRNLLIDLETIASLDHIEEIDLRPVEKAREIRLKLWLAQAD